MPRQQILRAKPPSEEARKPIGRQPPAPFESLWRAMLQIVMNANRAEDPPRPAAPEAIAGIPPEVDTVLELEGADWCRVVSATCHRPSVFTRSTTEVE